MNIKKCLAILILSVTVPAGSLMAGDTNTLMGGSGSGQPGGTASFDVTWVDLLPDTTVGLEFFVSYNNALFSLAGCTFNPPWNTYFQATCVDFGNQVRVGLARNPTAQIENGSVTIQWNILGGTAPGTYEFPIPAGQVTTVGDLDTTLTSPGSIEVLGPSYDPVNPATDGAGGATEFNFGSLTMGVDPNGELPLVIGNDGEMGTTLNGSCSITGAGASAFSQTPNNTFSVVQGGSNDESTIVCNSSAAVGSYSALLSCMHTGDSNPPSPVQYDLACTILAAPAPNYSSSPTPNTAFNFGTPLSTDPPVNQDITITNNGNDDGLTGACAITINPNMAYSVDTTPYDLNESASTMRTVTCDTSVVGDHSGGQMTCTAEAPAANAGSFTYPLNCEVLGIPTYDSTPAAPGPLPMNGDEGDGDATTSLLVENVGQANSTLTGTCGLSGQPQISIDGSAAFSLGMGATDTIDLACSGTEQGTFTSTLTCTADAPASNAGDFEYDVECTIDPPDPAQYVSSPYAAGNPGDTIDLNEGGDPPPVGSDPLMTVLNIMNGAQPGDDYLDLIECAYSGDAAISASPPVVTDNLDPGQSVAVTFTCATDTADTFNGTYTCPFDDNPSNIPPPAGPDGGPGVTSPATYPVTCEVREQFSDVVESPPSGTPQTAELMPSENHIFDFEFEEVIGEGLNGELLNCTLANDTDFSIISPVMNQTIPSGGPPLLVQVEFTDPGMGDTFTDTLDCTFEENPDGGEPEEVDVSWPLEVTVVGRNARFRVTKDFSDDNPAGVEVFLECNTGLPLQQQAVIHDPDAAGDLEPGDFTHVDFVVVDFDPGTMDCDITETVPVGYSEVYFADVGEDGTAGDVFADGEGCHYEDVESADFVCEITNNLDFVTVTVNKEWIDDNPEFQLPTFAEIEITCNEPVFRLLQVAAADQIEGNGNYSLEAFIQPGFPGVFGVYPHWDGSTECSVTETPEAGVLQDTSDCASIPLAPGVNGECTIVNTRLYAGIPTLSQYGLLVLALLMLGVGLVGFRRYA